MTTMTTNREHKLDTKASQCLPPHLRNADIPDKKFQTSYILTINKTVKQ